jgi:hypothetical protein
VVSLDGAVQPLHLKFPVGVPVLWFLPDPSLIDTVEAAGRLQASPGQFRAFRAVRDAQRDSLLARAAAGSFAAVIEGARHYQFSDLPLLLGDPPVERVTLPSSRVVEILRAYVVRFLALRAGQASPGELERLGRRYPEVRPVERRRGGGL